ncbi:hypothetical protein PR003_g8384 [Phytophthora rubi]|uniref:Crinkler effector protein N-terminal domain-containing protein n=1 Tax=Phytophthora rubi TaxID=129364 RepID=A0A6A3MZK1_9STRA|nr:hypothetical protein PR002_g7949 [Phytophthora rubi]KAE9039182.1 hypothetical protein PR001_g7620 [Phytophthora rubi]KAE9344592.1 hypothetical protein PR003_g8384 [Phytophthora rubi]
MVRLELNCTIVGEGRAFDVKIDDGKKVTKLQEAIKKKNEDDLSRVDAKNLQLYLAKKDGVWLNSADAASVELDEDGTPRDFGERMGPVLSIQDTKHFGANFQPDAGRIHVLVVVPEDAVGPANETSMTYKMIKEIHERTVLTQRKKYVHSQVGSTEFMELLDAFNIRMNPVRTAEGKFDQVKGFRWNTKLSKEKQKDEYCAYRERNIGELLQEQRLCVFDVENTEDILRVVPKGSNIELCGRTNLLMLSDIVIESDDYAYDLPEVKMLIEVKQKVEKQSVYHTMSELIALDFLAEGPVAALLTDCNRDWRFFWVAGKENDTTRVNRVHITSPGKAFELIRGLLNPTDSTEATIPVLQGPLKHQKLSQVMRPMTHGMSEACESGGVRECIERYNDIASILGPDVDMAREVGRLVAGSIPSLSYLS